MKLFKIVFSFDGVFGIMVTVIKCKMVDLVPILLAVSDFHMNICTICSFVTPRLISPASEPQRRL